MRACTQTKKVLLKACLHQCSITKLRKYRTYAILQKNLTETTSVYRVSGFCDKTHHSSGKSLSLWRCYGLPSPLDGHQQSWSIKLEVFVLICTKFFLLNKSVVFNQTVDITAVLGGPHTLSFFPSFSQSFHNLHIAHKKNKLKGKIAK